MNEFYKKHIIPHQHMINRDIREKMNGHRGSVIWLYGLSGSGKSTIASELEKSLHAKGIRTFILDGDNIRTGINADLDFTAEDREENIRRISEVAKLMMEAGIVVITAFIAPFQKDREKAAEIIGENNLIHIFVDCPLEECERRDVKGLYKKARAGEIPHFTGISSPFEIPDKADLTLYTAQSPLEECVQKALHYIEPKLIL